MTSGLKSRSKLLTTHTNHDIERNGQRLIEKASLVTPPPTPTTYLLVFIARSEVKTVIDKAHVCTFNWAN